MRVLFLAKPVSFINQIVVALKKRDPRFSASVLSDGIKSNSEIEKVYEQLIDFRFSLKSIVFGFRTSGLFLLFLIKSLGFLIISYKQGLKSFKCVFDAFSYIGRIQHARVGKYNVVNLHYLNIKRAISVLLLPSKSHVIISFWGSDLLRTNGLVYNYWVRKALLRANKIQVSSMEMREILLSEFGHELKSKVHLAMFIPNYQAIQQLTDVKEKMDYIASVRKKYAIPEGRCVMIGNNGNPGNNHIQILDAIADVVKEKDITVLLPLTYSLKKAHEKRIVECVEMHGMRAVYFKAFLSAEELAALRTLSNVFISMQETDAMSAFLTEAMYAGNVCIAASWLPYSRFRQSGAYYLECPGFEELGDLFRTVASDYERYRLKCAENARFIEAAFYQQENLEMAWESLFN